MIIKDSGAGGQITDQIIEASLQKLGFEFYNNVAITDAMLGNCTLAINRITKGGGSQPILFTTNLQHLLEIASNNEGAYRATLVTGLVVIGTIDLSNFGTLLLGEDYLTVSFNHSNGATFGVKIYAIEGDQYTDIAISYEPNTVLADTPKTIDVSECYGLALPVANFVKIIMQFADGRTATYTDIEMKMICADVNDLVSVLGGGAAWVPVYSYNNLYCLMIQDVVNLTVHYSTQTKFYVIKNS